MRGTLGASDPFTVTVKNKVRGRVRVRSRIKSGAGLRVRVKVRVRVNGYLRREQPGCPVSSSFTHPRVPTC